MAETGDLAEAARIDGEGLPHYAAQGVYAAGDPELGVNDARQGAVKGSREAPWYEWIEVVTFGPVSLVPDVGDHLFVVTRARQRVAYRDADVVGKELAHEGACGLHLRPTLTEVAELQEEPDAYAVAVERFHGGARLLDRDSLLHRVENSLRARLGAEPHLARSGALERVDVLVGHQIGARLAEEGGPYASLGDRVRPRDKPVRLQPQDVVAKPEVVGRVALPQHAQLGHDLARRAAVVGVAVVGLRAPVTQVR